jgi:hypothetical protein
VEDGEKREKTSMKGQEGRKARRKGKREERKERLGTLLFYLGGVSAILELRFALAFVFRFLRNSLNSFSSLGVRGLFTKTKS